MKSLLVIFYFLFALNSFATNTDPYFEISEVSVKEVAVVADTHLYESEDKTSIKDVIAIIDDLIALGKKVWPLIEGNKPVLNTDMSKQFSVLPNLEGDNVEFFDMENWSFPKAKSYRVEYKNGYGAVVVGFTYTVQFQYGGQYNGVGRYLSGIRVSADQVSVLWGYNFNAKSEMINIANLGTKDFPVAGATVQVSYVVKNVLKEMRSKQSFYVSGRGEIMTLK